MKRILTCIIGVVGLAWSAVPAHASTPDCTLSGVAVDSISRESIPYVTVGVENAEGKVLTRVASNDKGAFTVILPTGAGYTVEISSVGYAPRRLSVALNVTEKSRSLGEIALVEGTELSEVTVVAQRPLIKNEIDKITYDMEADPEATSNNALDMLRKIPLITVDAEENIRLNGQSNYKVLMNGKSSSILSGDNVKDILKSMPASSIKNIEVITNPSSKYEAEGVGGIINIITVSRWQSDGVVGSVGLNGDSFGGFGGNAYVSSQIGKFAFSARYSANRYTNGSGSHPHSLIWTESNPLYYHSEASGETKYKGLGQNASIELSYEIDTLNLISFSAWGWWGGNTSDGTMSNTYWNRENAVSQQYNSATHSKNNYGSISGTLDYQRSFAKKERTLTASYQFEYNPDDNQYNNEVEGIVNYDTYRENSYNKAYGMEHTIQLDYFDPLTDVHQIEGGLKYILRDNKSDGDRYRDLWNSSTQEWLPEVLPNNNLNYMQHVLGLYAGYVVKVKKWNGKVGARVEATWNDGNSVGIDESGKEYVENFDNRQFNVIPYATIAWQPREMQTLKLSYTQRLSRPGIWQLNPFRDTSTPLQVSYGNPDLKAGVSHALSLSYSLFTAKGVNLSADLTGRWQDNGIGQLLFVDERGVFNNTYDNYGRVRECNLNLFFSANILPTLSFNTNLLGGYGSYKAQEQGISNEGWTYNAYAGLRWNGWKDGAISANGGYYSGFRALAGKSGGLAFCSFSVSQSFLQKRLQLNLSVSNPFSKERNFVMYIVNEGYSSQVTQRDPWRQIRLGITYRFGQKESAVKKARRSINNDDVQNNGEGGSMGSGL